MHPLLFILLALIALTLLSGGLVFWIACRRRAELPWLVEEEIKKTDYGKYYEHICHAHQWLQLHDPKDVWIKSTDGLRLHALWIPAEQAKGTVLLAHGYRSTILADFAMIFDFYHGLGLNLLVPDQRCHGKSEGKYITFGIKESSDMLQWLDFHNRTYGNYPVVLNGLSMGASTMLYLADEELPENVMGIIADCGFTSPWEIIGKVYRSTVHFPALPSLVTADLFARIFAGFSLRQKDTRKTLANNRLPILVVHGLDDSFVPVQMTEAAFSVCAGSKQLLLMPGADHGVSFLADPVKYTQTIMDFLNVNLEGFA